MKQVKVIFLAVIIVVVVGIGGIKSYESYFEKKIEGAVISSVDLSKVIDGTYTGSYKIFPVSAEVKVTVKNNKITEIQLIEHKNGQGAQAESILDRVLEAQTLEVDIVSGATASSKVILKAMENALRSPSK